MAVKVIFRCGHPASIDPTKEPCCRQCGETGIARCFAPAPRFVGHVLGPQATPQVLGPAIVDLTQKEDAHG
jgi:hypothetical protein